MIWAIEFLFLFSIIQNRYITICHPLKRTWHFGKRSTMYCILLIWIFGSIPSYVWVEFTDVSKNRYKILLLNIMCSSVLAYKLIQQFFPCFIKGCLYILQPVGKVRSKFWRRWIRFACKKLYPHRKIIDVLGKMV